MLRATTSKCRGHALDAVNGGGRAAQASRRRKRYRVLQLRCIDDEDSSYAPGERPRSPTRPIPRCGKLGNLPGPYPQQHRELGTTRNYGFSDAADLFTSLW